MSSSSRHANLTGLESAVDAARFLSLVAEEGLTAFGDEMVRLDAVEVKKKQLWTAVVCEITYPTPLTVLVKEVHYVMLKKGVSKSFDRDFGKGPGLKCNAEVLRDAKSQGAFMTFVVHKGYILTVRAKDFLNWAESHETLYATNYGGAEQRDAVMPISLMTQIFPRLPAS